jgi:hypothetical protein
MVYPLAYRLNRRLTSVPPRHRAGPFLPAARPSLRILVLRWLPTLRT